MSKRDIPGLVAPPPLVYAGGLAAGLVIDHWHPYRFLPPAGAGPAGIVLLGLGLVALVAIVAFLRAGTSPNPWKPATRLVTSGVYRVTRNPMYLGFTLLYLGVTCWVNSLWPLLLLPLVLTVMHYGVIRREEKYLEEKFGEEYRQYARRVRRWL